MPHIVSIVYKPEAAPADPPDRYVREPLETARLEPGRGIAGDQKGRARQRQLNIMSAEQLAGLSAEGFNTTPGQMGEQLVLAGLDFAALQPGTRLQLGASAIVELGTQRTGCDRFEAIQGKAPSLAAGRLGFMANVIAGGEIRVGDEVVVVEKEAV